MASNFVVHFLFISSLSLATSSTFANNGINWWCNQTPNPKPCRYFMSHDLKPKHKADFKKMMIQIALDRTRFSYNQTKDLIHKLKNNERDKVAWANCLTLYENTISELNKALNPTKKYCTEFDKQTWLSTALTNLETCKSELFDQLGHVLDFIPPHIYNNVSELISNGLAMHNKLAIPQTQTYKLGFPTWVTRRDRKLLQSSTKAANLVVAKDGSGNFKTIGEALDAAAKKTRSGRFVIHIKSGVYAEYIRIDTDLKNIMLVGDGMESTIITGNRSKGGGFTIFTSATVAVTSDGFIARDITFRNTAGPQNNQAVALRVGSDLSVFYKCGFEGYQDTLYAHSQRQFYRECNIYGTIDFIFGNAASIFQNCNIFVRKPLSSQKNVVTAQGRTDPNQNTGIIIQKSRIAPSSDLKPVISSFPTYLGRPWKKYSRTIFMENFLDSFINPSGWLKWDGSNFALNTLFYGEYKNYGPGSSTSERVNWGGYKIFTSVAQVSQFSVANFIGGKSWLPAAGVPFTSEV